MVTSGEREERRRMIRVGELKDKDIVYVTGNIANILIITLNGV